MFTSRNFFYLFFYFLEIGTPYAQQLSNDCSDKSVFTSYINTYELEFSEYSKSQSIVALPHNAANLALEKQVNGINTPIFVTIDSQGRVIQAKQLVVSQSTTIRSHQRTTDNGFICIGVFGNGINRAIIVKLDSSLAVQWVFLYGGSVSAPVDGYTNGQQVIQTRYGNFAFVCFISGLVTGEFPKDIKLVRLSSNGSLISQHWFRLGNGSFVYDLKQDVDGGFIISGFTRDASFNSYFFKVDSSTLNVLWSYRHGGPLDDTNISVQPVGLNEYIAFGYNRGFGPLAGVNMYAIRFNCISGQVIWSRCYGTNGDDITTEALSLSDGNFLIVGVTNIDKVPQFQNLYVKIDPNGNVLWSSKNSSNASLLTELNKVAEMNNKTFRSTAIDYSQSNTRAKVFSFSCSGFNECSIDNYPISYYNINLPISTGQVIQLIPFTISSNNMNLSTIPVPDSLLTSICDSILSVPVDLDEKLNLFIPNTVTMNGDGFNDLFKIENLSLYAQNQLQILNRWGRVVFKSDNYQNNWPPSDVVAGAYYYVLDLSGPDESYKGWIEVLK